MTRLWLPLLLACSFALPARAGTMPDGFVYLRDVAPSIRQDMRYAGSNNFTGASVSGYEAGECVLAKPVAEALAKVQAALEREGRSLVVHDCYRPARAVRRFVEWVGENGENKDSRWHPRLKRSALIAEGYIAARSGHSSGGSVDLSFGRIDAGGSFRLADMGSEFDLFDPLSHTASPAVAADAAANRDYLVRAMRRQGFSNYKREWWHYRFNSEPFEGKAFDFPVSPR
jgi:D-alanyl-D-alanine dipeptidase